jgi:cytochrome c oxidase subunit 2
MLGVAVVSLSGCSSETKDEWKRIAMPPTVTKEGASNLALWQGAWIAAMVTGVITWGLIFYAMWRFRRRSATDIPVQTRYNLPLEIFYTIAPVLMCIVFFTHTVKSQDVMLDQSNTSNTIEVTGQQWSWTFNYGLGERNAEADDFVSIQKEFPYSSYVFETGTASYIPTIWLPVDVTTRFNLHSPDVIHDFGVPSFHMRMDVVPGRVNHYAVTPTKIGDYVGKCYELCGVSHSRMLFNVKVVSQADYDNHLKELLAEGAVHDTPLIGGSIASTQAGLEGDSE